MLIFCVIALSASVNLMFDGSPVRDVVCCFYIANEGISILENTADYLPIPDKLKEMLLQLKNKGGV